MGLLFLLIQTDGFQTWLARRLTAYISSETNSKITVGRVSLRFFSSAVLHEVYVEDQQKDTLFWFDELAVAIDDISTEKRQLDIRKLTLEDGYFQLLHTKGKPHDNLYFLLDYFSSADTTPSGSAPWKISVKEVELDGFRFTYHDYNEQPLASGVDFSHLEVIGVKGDIHDLRVHEDSIFAQIDRLAFREKSGFNVLRFSGNTLVCDHEIRVEELEASTDRSQLKGDLDFQYASWDDFDDFITKVRWKGQVKPSRISSDDIAFFTDELIGMDLDLNVEGFFKGTVSKFKGKDVRLSWGNRSTFTGSFAITGLPEVDDTYLDIQARDIRTCVADAERLVLYPFNKGERLQLPDNLNCLEDVQFQGKFTGFFTDFVAYGNIQTGIGYISSDINVKFDDRTNAYGYSGHINTNRFDIGKLTITPGMGVISMDADIKGQGVRIADINAKLDGKIALLEYRGYAYKNLDVEGRIAKKLFNGSVIIREPEVDLTFDGAIDMRQKLPVFDFTADVRRVELEKLNLFEVKEPYVLSTVISSHLVGNQPDNLSGSVSVSNTFLQVDKKVYHLNHLDLVTKRFAGKERSLELTSDILDADVNGQFEFAALPAAFREIIPRYLPNVLLPVKGAAVVQDFTFDVRLKNTSIVTENFFPDYSFDPRTRCYGSVRSADNRVEIHFDSPDFKLSGTRWKDLATWISTESDHLAVSLTADTLYYSKNGFVPNVQLSGGAADNRLGFRLRMADMPGQSNVLRWNGLFAFKSVDDFQLTIDSSYILIDGSPWAISEGNHIHYDTTGVHFTSFGIAHDSESVVLNGRIGKSEEDLLSIDFSRFFIDHLNPALNAYSLQLKGVADGRLTVSHVYDDIRFNSDLLIGGFGINGDTIGDAGIIIGYNSAEKEVLVDVSVTKGSARIISLKGKYDTDKKEDNLDFRLTTENLYLHSFERFTDGLISNLRGKVSMDVSITGTPERPDFSGYADFKKAAATIEYLKTRYNFSNRVEIHPGYFDLSDILLYDENGHESGVKGRVSHTAFEDWNFDLELFPRNFQALNTALVDNELFYGKANATGYVHIYGSLDDMLMDIALSPNKGSVINIPLSTTSEITESDFITFINRRDTADTTEHVSKVNLSGLRLNMSLDITPDAEINLIFDEKIGDVITGSGSGNLRMDINTLGDFNMYGTFTIEKGTYLFTLQNLINKRFQIDNGGRITWGGDPYDANIDMTAVYTVYTGSLVNLIQDSTFQRRVPVDLRLNLTGKLMNPSINYEIAVRAQDPTIESMVRTVLNSEQEVNRQMFGLLVFNQFLPPSVNTSSVGKFDAGAGAMASATELLSNQVSNWLSQLSKDVNIGFNYRAKDTYTNEEINLMFSKSLFNDRLLVETNVGVMGTNAAATNQNSNTVVGEFYTEYKVSKDGRFRLKAYNRSNADDLINFNAPYTQGVGVFFRQDFNSLSDLKQRLGLSKKPESPPTEEPKNRP